MANGHTFGLGPDETFGEMAIVDGSPREPRPQSPSEGFTRIAVINRHRFLFLVGETPSFALQVMASLAERLRASQAQAGVSRKGRATVEADRHRWVALHHRIGQLADPFDS